MFSANKQKHWLWMLVAIIGLGLTGCEYENPFEKAYRPPKPKRLKKKERLSISEKVIPFVYVPIKKRDPFRPWFLNQTTLTTAASNKPTKPIVRIRPKRKPRTELEKFELDQLKVVATITGVANPVAMVEGPDGEGFVIRHGTSIGRNGGRVTRIYSTGIVISEVTRDNAGRRIIRRIMIRVKGDKGRKTRGSLQVGDRKLSLDSSGNLQYQSLQRRTDQLFRKRSVGAQ